MKSKDFSSLEGKFFSTKTQFPFVPKINKISRTIEFICLKSIKALKSILKKIISIVNQSDYYYYTASLIGTQMCWIWNLLVERYCERFLSITSMLSKHVQPLTKSIQVLYPVWKGVFFHGISFIMSSFRQISKNVWFTYFKLNSFTIQYLTELMFNCF